MYYGLYLDLCPVQNLHFELQNAIIQSDFQN